MLLILHSTETLKSRKVPKITVKSLKGQEGTPIESIIGIVFALIIAVIVIALFFPAITSTEDAAGCQGLLRPLASFLANTAGVEIC